MESFETADTGIFWDVDDCPVPKGLNALMVCQNMRYALEKLNYHGKVNIYAYGDSNQILDDLHPPGDEISTLDFGKASISATDTTMVFKQTPDNFDYCGTTSIYTQDDLKSGDKDELLDRILVDFMMWAVDNPAPANVILILGNNITRRQELFTNALGQVNLLRYNIHFAYPQNSICLVFPAVRNKWLWENLSVGGSPLS